jgi:hypothetical protein
VKLYAAHAATIKAGLSRAQQTARFPWYDPSARCMYLTAYTSFLSGHSNAHAARHHGQLRTLTQQSGRPSALRLAGQKRASRHERCRPNEVIELRPGFKTPVDDWPAICSLFRTKPVKPKAGSKETKVAVFFVYPLACPGRTA